jgi:hypothetical protein
MNQNLYVILPYFNYAGWKNRVENTLRFIQENIHLQKDGVKFVLVEGVHKEDNKLRDVPSDIHKHIVYNIKHPIWIKENLINLAIQQLPKDWQYVAWVDADIFFTNANWHHDARNLLSSNNMLQLFTSVVNVDKRGNLIENPCFAQHSIAHSGSLEWGHPGHAWAIHRSLYDKIEKLYDKCIVGGADTFIAALALAHGDVASDVFMQMQQLKISEPFLKYIVNYIGKFKDAKVACVNGVILHYYHGDIRKRKYVERQQILAHVKYDPGVHVVYGEQGVIEINTQAEHAKVLVKNIKHYFESRREDEDVAQEDELLHDGASV